MAIKNEDLCAGCVFDPIRCNSADCMECPQIEFEGDTLRCKCDMIRDNTPCPYFEERRDEDGILC